MGLIRDSSDDYIDSLSNEEIKTWLKQLNEHTQLHQVTEDFKTTNTESMA